MCFCWDRGRKGNERRKERIDRVCVRQKDGGKREEGEVGRGTECRECKQAMQATGGMPKGRERCRKEDGRKEGMNERTDGRTNEERKGKGQVAKKGSELRLKVKVLNKQEVRPPLADCLTGRRSDWLAAVQGRRREGAD